MYINFYHIHAYYYHLSSLFFSLHNFTNCAAQELRGFPNRGEPIQVKPQRPKVIAQMVRDYLPVCWVYNGYFTIYEMEKTKMNQKDRSPQKILRLNSEKLRSSVNDDSRK